MREAIGHKKHNIVIQIQNVLAKNSTLQTEPYLGAFKKQKQKQKMKLMLERRGGIAYLELIA